jgi:hypothetical protein
VGTLNTTREKRDAVNYTFMLPHRPGPHTKQSNALAKAVIFELMDLPGLFLPVVAGFRLLTLTLH